MGALLTKDGFKKEAVAKWICQEGESVTIVQLQRSQFGHTYYINVARGPASRIPEGEKPDEIFFSGKERQRIVSVDFEEERAKEKYPHEAYYFPSVNDAGVRDRLNRISAELEKYLGSK